MSRSRGSSGSARGVLINKGHGPARVRLDGSARFIEGQSQLVGSDRYIPPKLGADLSPEYLLCTDDVALFEWGYGQWADAQENPRPANPNGACFLTATVTDWLSSGMVDHCSSFWRHVRLPVSPACKANGGFWTLRRARLASSSSHPNAPIGPISRRAPSRRPHGRTCLLSGTPSTRRRLRRLPGQRTRVPAAAPVRPRDDG